MKFDKKNRFNTDLMKGRHHMKISNIKL